MTDWFEEWFGEEYLALYPHRDDEEAQTAAKLIRAQVRTAPGARALDLACGAGRHAEVLGERWWTVGLDLSPALLQVARLNDRATPLVRADMRTLPFHDGAFALVVNLFTSFGYFRNDSQHERVVREVARVTQRGGWFVLDYLNAPHVIATLVPWDERRVGSRVVEQERAISADGRFVSKTITLDDEARTFVERVRLFTRTDLEAMLTTAGFAVSAVVGDYRGTPHDDTTPRTIVFGQRQ